MPDSERNLVLVRHSLPEMVSGVPASQWRLSAEGRRRCEALAEQLSECEPAVVVTSQEPKAAETGHIVADILSVPFATEPDLHEHERDAVRDPGREQFEARVARFFAHPGQLVFGRETADQAHERFAGAVLRVLDSYPEGTPAIVSHGTVMTLFVARANGLAPLPFWKSLGLPSLAVLSVPGFDLLKMVRDVLDKAHS